MYITPTPSLLNPFSRTLPTMPTICRGGSSNCGPSPLPMTITCPSGSSFGQYFWAMAWLIRTARADDPVSDSLKTRPRSSGILKVAK